MFKEPPFDTLLLEDEKPARDHFSAAITSHPDLVLQDAVGHCADAIISLQNNEPDILISDLGLPDGSGIKVIQIAKSLYPDIEILVVTMFGDEETVVAALEAGASGYLLKKQAFETLGESVLCLMRGESAISPEVARFLLRRFNKTITTHQERKNKEVNPLTERENEVLTLIAKGYTYDEIAAIFSLSTNTIRAHIRNIYRKLSVKSRSEAVYEANQMGILEN